MLMVSQPPWAHAHGGTPWPRWGRHDTRASTAVLRGSYTGLPLTQATYCLSFDCQTC